MSQRNPPVGRWRIAISWAEVAPRWGLPWPASATMRITAMGLRDGVVEAGFMAVAIPASAVLDLGSTRKVRFIPLSDLEIKRTLDAYPYYSAVPVPENGYQGIGGISGDTPAVGVQNVLVCQGDLPEELVYNIVKTIFESRQKLFEVHQVANQITLENAAKVPIAMHPGAVRYFKEMGVLK